MIHGSYLTKTMVGKIRECSLDFHLTGSRFFNTANVDSDWDFFVQDSSSVIYWLEDQGFIKEGVGYGLLGSPTKPPEEFVKDPSICQVWGHSGQGEDNVHVQVIKKEMMHIKIRAQDIIRARNLLWRPSSVLSGGVAKMMNKAVWCAVQHTLIADSERFTEHV